MAFPDINIGSKFDAKGFKQAQSATDKLNKSVKSLASTFGIAFGTTAVVAFAKASVKAFIQDDNAARSLGITLKNLGLETGNTSKYVNEMISNLEKQSGVLDDELRPAMDRLLRATGSVSKATTLLGLALDISAGTGKDLTTVTQGLQKAYLGNNASLGRLGVGLSKAELTSSSFEEIQIKLSKLFAGQASSAAESYAGQLNKLTIAGNNAKEAIGKGIIDALKGLGDDTTVADLATNMENLAIYTADVIRGFGLMAAALKKIPGLSGLTGASIVQAIPILGSYITLLNQAGAQSRRAAEVGAQKNPIQSGSYLATQKKITVLTNEQAAAQAKILAAKKLALAIDKGNLALAKGNDVFDMDKIQLNAALIGQAEALGKATTGSQILAIANDVQRLKVKQDIAALEDAIASKDTVAIEKATAKLNQDLAILGTLQKQDATLLSISDILKSLKPKDLINLENLAQAALILASMGGAKTSAQAFMPASIGGGSSNITAAVAGLSLNVPVAGRDFNPNQNADRNYTNNVINVTAGVIGDENIIVDAVQNALNEIARRGYLTTYAGALPA